MSRGRPPKVYKELEGLPADMSIEDIGEAIFELNKASYEEKPVDITTFVEDSYFLGSMYGSEPDSVFYPWWLNHLKKIHPSPFFNPYTEVILHLPIGAGKSVFALTSVLYDLYKLLCLKDPQVFYGIRPQGTQITFAIFSALKYLANDDEWGRFSGMIGSSLWFKDRGVIPPDRVHPTVIFAKGCGITLGTSAIHALGKAVIGGLLDEANFLGTKNDKIKSAYLAVSRRMESRFLQKGGTLPGILFLASSPKFATSFLSERIEAANKSKSTYIVANAPIWHIKGHLGLYSGEMFPIYTGDEFTDPFILEPEAVTQRDPAKIMQVPIEYLDSFQKDMIESIRDIVGTPIAGSQSFFRGRGAIALVATMPHRFSKEVIELTLDNDAGELLDYVDKKYFSDPIFPEAWRFIHVDLSVTMDRTGIGCVFCLPQKTEFFDENGRAYEKSVRSYYMDFGLVLKAKQGQEVPHYKIEAFLLYLKRNGYPIKTVTFDQYQSRTTMQNLLLQGFDVRHCSVDAKRDAYIGLRTEILNKTILLTKHSLLVEELANLQDDGQKIDHLPHLSKDLSDGLAGAYFGCQQSNTVLRITDLKPRAPLLNPGRFQGVKQLRKEMMMKGVASQFLPSYLDKGIRL
jgi:hypothetical protein